MVSFQEVETQLKQVGCNFTFWGRPEIRELGNVLMPEEKIAQAVNGSYEGGFALLVVTNFRVLLIDRKPMMLTIEDIRYDMIAEVDFSNRLMGASVRIFTPMRTLGFNSWSNVRLRKCVHYIQQRVMEIRHHSMGPQLAVAGQAGIVPALPMNPYTKMPLLSRSRRFPSLY